MANRRVDIESQQPLLGTAAAADDDGNTITALEKAISRGCKSTADLAKHLPTGTVLAFQLLSPILTNQGQCHHATRAISASFLALCAISCFLFPFTDSFRDATGKLRYVFATFNGCWVVDGSSPPPPGMLAKYRIKVKDFIHGFMSLLVFAAVALYDKNVESCFYPSPSEDMKQVLAALPTAAGVIGSLLFVVFPSTRQGIGFPGPTV
ncbi:protein DMP4-like [Typha latifolia]|uniref:protein DMP4-like n=1 Tax=Typha latifolia TaxID=4733 RepID=UPI003C2D9035